MKTPVFISILLVLIAAQFAHAVDRATMQSWGLETFNETERTLRLSNSALYAETANLDGSRSGGLYNRSFVWPAATQFRVLNTMTQINPATYAPKLRQFSDQLHASYYNAGYRSAAGPSERFYDDNGHLVVSLVEAYRLTNDVTYLNRAKLTQSFVMQGESSAGGGGIYFREGSTAGKDAISTLQGARGAAMLYRATGEAQYLADATRLLTWSETHIQQPDGLYYQHYSTSTNTASGIPLVNSAGIGITTNLELFDATGDSDYLTEAQRIANRTLTRYFDGATGRLNDQGYWAFELVDALDDLHMHDGNGLWLNKVDTAMNWLRHNKRDPNGHYGATWGSGGFQATTLSSWHLNEQASVARAFLYTSVVPEPGSIAALCVATALLMLRRVGRERVYSWHGRPARALAAASRSLPTRGAAGAASCTGEAPVPREGRCL